MESKTWTSLEKQHIRVSLWHWIGRNYLNKTQKLEARIEETSLNDYIKIKILYHKKPQ